MPWATYRRGRRLTVALPPDIKNQLVKVKARGGPNIGQQIVEALRHQWGWVQGSTPAVTQPALSTPRPQQPIVPGSTVYFNGQPYRLQKVVREGSRMPDWNL